MHRWMDGHADGSTGGRMEGCMVRLKDMTDGLSDG